MPITTLSGPPSEATIGDTVRWREAAPSDIAEIISAEYHFVTRTGERFVATGAAEDADNWVYSFSGADTAAIPAGSYDGARVKEYSFGRVTDRNAARLTLRPDPTREKPETHNAKMVRLLEAHIEGRAADGIESSTINGVPITKMDMETAANLLREYRGYLLQEQKAEAAKAGKGTGNRILIKF